MSGKTLPPPGGGQDLTALLRSRHVQTEAAVPPPASPVEPSEALVSTDRPGPALENVVREVAPAAPRRASAEMDRRSWYMPKASADALAEAVEELHWQTRQPKHAVLAALLEVALQHRDQAAKKLSH